MKEHGWRVAERIGVVRRKKEKRSKTVKFLLDHAFFNLLVLHLYAG